MKKVVLLFITTILLFSCSDDDEKEKTWNEINIPVPTMSKMVMTEVEETYMTTSTAINTIKSSHPIPIHSQSALVRKLYRNFLIR